MIHIRKPYFYKIRFLCYNNIYYIQKEGTSLNQAETRTVHLKLEQSGTFVWQVSELKDPENKFMVYGSKNGQIKIKWRKELIPYMEEGIKAIFFILRQEGHNPYVQIHVTKTSGPILTVIKKSGLRKIRTSGNFEFWS